jgi:hypothetical protein
MSAAYAQRALAMLERAKARGVATSVSITRAGEPGEYDPETGPAPGCDPTTFTGTGLKVGYEQSDIDGTRVQQGDQQVYAEAVNLPRPVLGEPIAVGIGVYAVVAFEAIAPGDVDVLYIIQIRGVP